MTDLPRLSEADIARWIDPQSYQRGLAYFRQGRIAHPRRQGDTLRADCHGSRPAPYDVRVTLGLGGIRHASCSCPVGEGGHCKHAAALLLTWAREPEAFALQEDLAASLAGRSQEELVALILRMLDRAPELEVLLELPVPGLSADDRPVDALADALTRAVDEAFSAEADEYGFVYGEPRGLRPLVQLGAAYVGREEWDRAFVVYRTIARECLSRYDRVDADSFGLYGVVGACVGGMGRCLAGAGDASVREGTLRALFDVYLWDLRRGTYGLADDVPAIIREHAAPAERRSVAGWVREQLNATDGSAYGRYHRETLGEFLLDLEGESLTDAEYLRICRETGRRLDLIDRLLALGEVAEAWGIAQRLSDYQVIGAAHRLVSHGEPDLAEELVRDRNEAPGPSNARAAFGDWLMDRALARGDLEEALALAQTAFDEWPSVQAYTTMASLAERLGRREPLRDATLAGLVEADRHDVVTRIHLSEASLDAALDSLSRVHVPEWGHDGRSLWVEVAEAVADARPRDAIRLYVEEAQVHIERRGRPSYALAADYLARVRDLYRRLGEEGAWRRCITGVREENRRLRALRDELDLAGL